MILFLFLCISVAFTRGIGALTKLFFYKDRPIPMKFNTFWTKLQAGTFPSLHTIAVTIVAMVVFRGTVELGFSQYIFLVYMVVIVAVALSRIELKKHYPADVFFGVIYGIVGTFLSIFGSTVILARIFKIFNLDVY
jgi:membrane-associated phospholipid phosphatase